MGCIFGGWKGERSGREVVDFFYEFLDTKEIFAEEFKIKSIRDLYGITRDELKQLYLEGKGNIVCRVNVPYSYFLIYKLINGCLIAENERFVKHPVENVLIEPEDFIRYARNYYELVNSCEN